MLGVGIDWAEEFHLVALGRPGDGVIEIKRVEHTPDALRGLIGQIAELEADPAEVRVVVETRHGALVEAVSDQRMSRSAITGFRAGWPGFLAGG